MAAKVLRRASHKSSALTISRIKFCSLSFGLASICAKVKHTPLPINVYRKRKWF